MLAPSSRDPWAFSAGLLLLTAAVLTAAHWPVFPYFLDSWYHLAVIRGFEQAGGPVFHAFWEAAPQGRPHLYPPLFHTLFLPAALAGVPPIQLARFWTWASFPLLLAAAWSVLSRVSSSRLACFAVIALATPYSFFLGTINYLPATLALIAGLGILLAISRQRRVAGALCLAAAFYLHAGIPWLLSLGLLLFGFVEPRYRKTCWAALAGGLLAASPWLIHLGRHLSLIQIQPRGEDRMLELPVPWLLLGIGGAVIAWRRKGILRFLPVLAVAFLPMALAGYRFRFLATQGLFPLLLSAAVALDWLAERMRPGWVLGALLAGLALLSPSMHLSPGHSGWAWGDTSLSGLSGLVPPAPRGTGGPIYNAKFMGELEEAILRWTGPDDLIYSNVHYLAGMMTALTGRAATNQMLREMAERPLGEQIPPARMILWLKNLSGKKSPEMERAVEEYHLSLAGETEIAYLFLNPSPTGHRTPVLRVFPWWVAILQVLLAGALALWDLRRS